VFLSTTSYVLLFITGCVFFVVRHGKGICLALLGVCNGCVVCFAIGFDVGGDAPPSSLCDPKRVQRVGFAEMVRNLVPLPTSSTKRGRGVMLEAPKLD
jgi:hypothetical protein